MSPPSSRASPAAGPPSPEPKQPAVVLQIWLAVLAVFLLLSAVAFVTHPDEQVNRLLENIKQDEATRGGCHFPCKSRRTIDGAPWWRASCPYRCGGPLDDQDFGLSLHLVKALGATYGTLGLLALVLRCAPRCATLS